MQDGFSTAGSPGSGLGAVRRLSTEFDIHSTPPAGTVVLARLFSSSHDGPEPDALAIGAVCLPAPGETESGDTWRMAEREGSATFMVADGLGHGPLAAQAAAQAAAIFEAEELSGPRAYLEKAHGVLRGGRGAAIAAARLDICTGTLRYAGIGNIAGSLIASGESRGLVSLNGTIGVQLHKVQDFDYDWPPGGLLVMHSDGLSTRWNLKGDPALSSRHPAVIAGALYRDFSRGRDDVTVFVARLKRPNGQSERG